MQDEDQQRLIAELGAELEMKDDGALAEQQITDPRTKERADALAISGQLEQIVGQLEERDRKSDQHLELHLRELDQIVMSEDEDFGNVRVQLIQLAEISQAFEQIKSETERGLSASKHFAAEGRRLRNFHLSNN